MEKRLGLVLSIVFVSLSFFGCATERVVIGNSFQSSFPKLNISIDPSFKFLGKTASKGAGSDYLDSNKLNIKQKEFYLFVPRNASQRLDRFLLIYIETIDTPNWYYVNTIRDNKSYLNLGTIEMQGDTYTFYSTVFSPGGTWDINKYMKDAGHLLPSCLMGRYFASYSHGSTLIQINYYEDATPSGMTCKQRYTRDGITDVQLRYLQELHQRALKTIGG